MIGSHQGQIDVIVGGFQDAAVSLKVKELIKQRDLLHIGWRDTEFFGKPKVETDDKPGAETDDKSRHVRVDEQDAHEFLEYVNAELFALGINVNSLGTPVVHPLSVQRSEHRNTSYVFERE